MEDEAQAAVALSPAQFQSNDWKLSRCRHGWMLWPKADDTIGRCLDLYGEFAEAENEPMRDHNIFANVGDMNILALPADRSQPDHLPEIVSPDED